MARLLFLLAFISCNIAFGDTRWIRMRTDHFEMYSTGSDGATRDALAQFERVRSFFTQVMPAHVNGPGQEQPVVIIGFNSEKDYAPYRFNEVAAAYYHPGADRDYIVMSRLGDDLFQTAVHEYVHL